MSDNLTLKDIEQKQSQFLEDGIRKYNTMICDYTGDLMEQVIGTSFIIAAIIWGLYLKDFQRKP